MFNITSKETSCRRHFVKMNINIIINLNNNNDVRFFNNSASQSKLICTNNTKQ